MHYVYVPESKYTHWSALGLPGVIALKKREFPFSHNYQISVIVPQLVVGFPFQGFLWLDLRKSLASFNSCY